MLFWLIFMYNDSFRKNAKVQKRGKINLIGRLQLTTERMREEENEGIVQLRILRTQASGFWQNSINLLHFLRNVLVHHFHLGSFPDLGDMTPKWLVSHLWGHVNFWCRNSILELWLAPGVGLQMTEMRGGQWCDLYRDWEPLLLKCFSNSVFWSSSSWTPLTPSLWYDTPKKILYCITQKKLISDFLVLVPVNLQGISFKSLSGIHAVLRENFMNLFNTGAGYIFCSTI